VTRRNNDSSTFMIRYDSVGQISTKSRFCWLGLALTLNSCGFLRYDENSKQDVGKKIEQVAPKPEAQAASPGSTQDSGIVGRAEISDRILPVGLMELTTEGVQRRCMVSSIGSGLAATAGHCFAGVPVESGSVKCPSELKIEWLKLSESGEYVRSSAITSCESFELSKIEGNDSSEFALLQLAKGGVWPDRKVQFVRQAEFVTLSPFAIVGPIPTDGGLAFMSSLSSIAFDVTDHEFLLDGKYQPGFSGSPVFKVSSTQNAIDFSAPAMGIYLGRGFGAGRVLRPKAFEKIIDSK
jgi:hypothetical protein